MNRVEAVAGTQTDETRTYDAPRNSVTSALVSKTENNVTSN